MYNHLVDRLFNKINVHELNVIEDSMDLNTTVRDESDEHEGDRHGEKGTETYFSTIGAQDEDVVEIRLTERNGHQRHHHVLDQR